MSDRDVSLVSHCDSLASLRDGLEEDDKYFVVLADPVSHDVNVEFDLSGLVVEGHVLASAVEVCTCICRIVL